MPLKPQDDLIRRKYRETFGATLHPQYAQWMEAGASAALGYRRADALPLFLETYLDAPIEDLVSQALGRPVEREAIVEIGNFAADNALAMIQLWGSAANDLSSTSEVAVATLTAPLRRMFTRIGLPITVLAPACRERLGGHGDSWGSYYDLDPQVCCGEIAPGQQAIAAFLARRNLRDAA